MWLALWAKQKNFLHFWFTIWANYWQSETFLVPFSSKNFVQKYFFSYVTLNEVNWWIGSAPGSKGGVMPTCARALLPGPATLPRTCCSKVVMTLTACCSTISLVIGCALPKWIVTMWPNSLKASFMSRTLNLVYTHIILLHEFNRPLDITKICFLWFNIQKNRLLLLVLKNLLLHFL